MTKLRKPKLPRQPEIPYDPGARPSRTVTYYPQVDLKDCGTKTLTSILMDLGIDKEDFDPDLLEISISTHYDAYYNDYDCSACNCNPNEAYSAQIVYNEARQRQLSEEKYQSLLNNYNRRCERYEKAMEKYKVELAEYQKNKAAYDLALKAYEEEQLEIQLVQKRKQLAKLQKEIEKDEKKRQKNESNTK